MINKNAFLLPENTLHTRWLIQDPKRKNENEDKNTPAQLSKRSC